MTIRFYEDCGWAVTPGVGGVLRTPMIPLRARTMVLLEAAEVSYEILSGMYCGLGLLRLRM